MFAMCVTACTIQLLWQHTVQVFFSHYRHYRHVTHQIKLLVFDCLVLTCALWFHRECSKGLAPLRNTANKDHLQSTQATVNRHNSQTRTGHQRRSSPRVKCYTEKATPGIAPNANATHDPTAGSSAAQPKPNHTPTRHPRATGKLPLQMVTPHAA